MKCSNCDHAEADHETVEYRGDKSRACVNVPGCRCRDFRKPKPSERETASIMKAAKIVGVSRRTLYNWLAEGKVEACRTAGGSVRIFVDTLFIDMGQLPKKQGDRLGELRKHNGGTPPKTYL